MFLSSTMGRFSVPTCRTAPRRAQEAVKAGRRPPPQAAQCGLDGREHRRDPKSSRQLPPGRGGLPTCCLRGYRPLLFLLATMVGSPIWIRTSSTRARSICLSPVLCRRMLGTGRCALSVFRTARRPVQELAFVPVQLCREPALPCPLHDLESIAFG